MQTAKILPIFKSCAKMDIKLQANFSFATMKKNLERLFLTKLDNCIDDKDILNSSQHTFPTAMSTFHTIMELIEKFFLFIDLKKAFDTADHKILIKKLISIVCVWSWK